MRQNPVAQGGESSWTRQKRAMDSCGLIGVCCKLLSRTAYARVAYDLMAHSLDSDLVSTLCDRSPYLVSHSGCNAYAGYTVRDSALPVDDAAILHNSQQTSWYGMLSQSHLE